MSRAPYMQLYPGDYHADTQELTCEEHGAYLLLLMSMWSHGGTLPFDHEKLRRIAKLPMARWKRTWLVLERFFHLEDGRITQHKLREMREKVEEVSAKRSRSGKLGAAAKHRKDNDEGLASAVRLPQHTKDHIPEDREEEIPNGISSKRERKRGIRLTPDWKLPRKYGIWSLENGMTEIEVREQADCFKDWALQQPGQKGVKLDWEAAWRNWCRKYVRDRAERQRPRLIPGGAQPPQPVESVEDLQAKLAAHRARKAKP